MFFFWRLLFRLSGFIVRFQLSEVCLYVNRPHDEQCPYHLLNIYGTVPAILMNYGSNSYTYSLISRVVLKCWSFVEIVRRPGRPSTGPGGQ